MKKKKTMLVKTEVTVSLVKDLEDPTKRLWLIPSGFKEKIIKLHEDSSYQLLACYKNTDEWANI